MLRFRPAALLAIAASSFAAPLAHAAPPRSPDRVEACDLLVVGGGLSGSAAAYEALLAGQTVCLTEITDWVGGQISAQGTSALDERPTQRAQLFYPRGYLALREAIEDRYGMLNPGRCWVSSSCFMPYDGHELLFEILEDAADEGDGELKWYPNTVVKELSYQQTVGDTPNNGLIDGAIAIQHAPHPDASPLNTYPLSETIEDAFTYEDSDRFAKTIVEFRPKRAIDPDADPTDLASTDANWYVIDATETGELVGLADVPYRLGIDPASYLEPTSSSPDGDQYCTQGFTYTFAMETQAEEQTYDVPAFYDRYAPYYSYELERLADFELVYTYRQIFSVEPEEELTPNVREWPIYPGDISMQNWTWGNDYRPGTSIDNLIFTRDQLRDRGQLEPGGWLGGLRTETLARGEEHSVGYFYWLVQGTTDSQLGDGVKQPQPFHTYMTGFDSPMGTAHGLSKYPYMREGRRIIGRPSFGHAAGFTIWEIDISQMDYRNPYFAENLSEDEFRRMWATLAGLSAIEVITGDRSVENIEPRTRASMYPDSVGIGHYAIDFHPCMTEHPPEKPGNTEREGERFGQGRAFPFPVPLRAMIPRKIDNLLVAGKSIATSHTAAAAYRVHSFEWSVGAAAGTTAAFALERNVMPYEMTDDLPRPELELEALQRRLDANGNPTAFPNTSIFNNSWDEWN
ncbi:MAG: FAD-dependent oxidoreductase [Geitlerinemataceae cyanobacterium]